MKKTKLSIILSGLMIVTAVIVASCKKSTTTTTPTPAQDTNTSSATDNNNSETVSRDLVNIGSESIDNGSLSTYRLNQGASILSGVSGSVNITADTTNKKVTVVFSNFLGYDGVTRNGTLIYSWIGNFLWFRSPGFYVSVTTTSANPYTISSAALGVGTYTVNITKKHIRNITSTTPGSNLTWSDTSNISIVKPSSSGTITWNCNRNTILVNTNAITYAGNSISAAYTNSTTPINWSIAVIGFTGNATGTTASGTSYSANITSRVDYNFNCAPYSYIPFYHPPVAGSIDFTPAGVTTRTLNFGTGTCDDSYTITIGAWSVTLNFI